MNFALFEDTKLHNTSILFYDLIQDIQALNYNEFFNALNKIEKYHNQGYYLAGYIAYEALSAFYPSIQLNTTTPLLHFKLFKKKLVLNSNQLLESLEKLDLVKLAPKKILINKLYLDYGYKLYQQKFYLLKNELKKGNSYQTNLTLNGALETNLLDDFSFYYQVSRAHPVSYNAFLPFNPYSVLSFSPELFFKTKHNKILVAPMKGTQKRGKNSQEDQKYYTQLATNHKQLSENLIIVDLLRNDLAKFCQTSSVKPVKLFEIEKYSSVFQMTSQISGKLKPHTSIKTILAGLFPCGSITGAPKLKTIELIKTLEETPRGIYTGCCGYILPNQEMVFNVAIRTLYRHYQANNYRFGVGGGITINSKPKDEFLEVVTKTKFLKPFYQPSFKLVESIKLTNMELINLDLHLKRMESSALQLGFNFNLRKIKVKIKEYLSSTQLNPQQVYKLRLELSYHEDLLIELATINLASTPLKIKLLLSPINTTNILFQHKTTANETRGLYTNLDQKYKPIGIDELVFINQQGVITEGRFYNLIIEYNKQLITSPVEAGLLNGIYRQTLIKAQKILSQEIDLAELNKASKIYLCNDVRGLIEAQYCGEIC